MIKALNSIPLLYISMLWPGRFALQGLFDEGWYYGQMMYDSGIWAIWLLLLTLAVTPALLVINSIGYGVELGRWLLQRRRHFGVGSFIYSALHLTHYIIETDSLQLMIQDAFNLDFFSGWVAFVIFLLLAITSNNASVRRLGRRWKSLHRWVYPAAAAMFLHWYLFDFAVGRVPFWLAFFIGVKLLHILLLRLRWRSLLGRKKSTP